ncbi:MAG: twin-arginine translocation signal domain-containing protein, partial [Polyangiaceae bacterium]
MKKLSIVKPPERAEFTAIQDAPPESHERRDFLKLAGASMALAGVAGCSRAPHGKIVPYATQPPEVTPGIASHFATALTREGYGIGVVVESHEGRPTKIEGNPDHPASLGGSGIFEQASLLDLYDRDRGTHISERGAVSSWSTLIAKLAENKPDRGHGVHLLLEPTSSVLTASLLTRLREKLPEAKLHFHAPLTPLRTWAGARLAFGEALETQIDFRKADVVLAIDSDFLTSGPASLRNARHFAERRKMVSPSDALNRLYVVEPSPTVTGSSADHRLRSKRADIPALVRALFVSLATRAENAAASAIANTLHFEPDPARGAFVRAL